MCDCFHVVLPSWAGAPGSASGRHLQPEDPETEDSSVTEVIRPRPQGSSPVYECAAEGSSLGRSEDERGRPSAGSWRAWWKRDSGDSRTLSRMSGTEECVETMLKTQVEAGASGYSVAGGGQQGLFVKQVLKDSTAAKLFSLQEGDQLLSATIFFDDIQYEDALKILQYSEPYKVQFCIRRRLPEALHTHQQEQHITESLLETPTRTLDGGDQERLISKTRTGRGRRAQRERLSWPKFQTVKSKGRLGPRRSHSSSEASEQGAEGDVSPTSTDTEAQHPDNTQDAKAGAGSRHRKSFMSLRLRKLTGKGSGAAWQGAGGAQGGKGHEGLQEETEAWSDGQEESSTGQQDTSLHKVGVYRHGVPSTEHPKNMGPGTREEDRKEAEMDERHTGRDEHERYLGKKDYRGTKKETRRVRDGAKGEQREVQELERELARLSLKDTTAEGITDAAPQGRKVQFPRLKTPKFRITTNDSEDTEGIISEIEQEGKQQERKDRKENSLEDKVVATRDSKFKMPKFKMPSFGGSAAGKSIEASVYGDMDMSLPKVEVGVSLPSAQGDLKTGDISIQLPSVDVDDKTGQVAVQLSETQAGEATLTAVDMEAGSLKGHLPKVKTPSFKMPKVDFKAPQVDIKSSKLDVRSPSPHMAVTLPSVDVELPAPDALHEADIPLGDKELAARDSKFKMPKFKMPSFGGSAAGKSIETSVHGDLDVSQPKVEADVSLPSAQGDLKTGNISIQLPSMDVEVKAGHIAVQLPEAQAGEVTLADVDAEAGGLKGHLRKVKTPSFKMPKVDFKAPQVDIKGPKLDMRGPSPRMDVLLSSADVDLRTPDASLEGDIALGDKDVAAMDSKFKMPKFKMPSIGGSTAGKSIEASVHGDLDVSEPKMEADVSLPSTHGDLKTSDLSVQLPSVDMGVKAGHVAVQLPEDQAGEATLADVDMAAGNLKGHLPKLKTPSFKMPKVDFKAPKVNIKGPKLDVRSPKAEGPSPRMDVTLPSVDEELPAADASLETDIPLGDKDMAARDSKFKMPKFKMPSFGGSAAGKSIEASVPGDLDVSLPKVEADVSLHSVQGEFKTGDLSVQFPSVDKDVKAGHMAVQLPEAQASDATHADVEVEASSLKGHLPKVKTLSYKMPKVDFKAPQVDIKGPKIDVRGHSPSVDVTLCSVDVDLQASNASLEADIALGDKDVAARDSKFKMPKFKMPSFGGSAAGKSIDASVHSDLDVSLPKVEVDVSLPSAQGDLSVPLPSVDVEVKAGHVAVQLPEAQSGEATLTDVDVAAGGLKGHLPKLKTPSFKMPKVDFKAPQVDIKGPKLDVRGPSPSMDVMLPSTDVDLRAPNASLEADIALGDKNMAARDSKFKMPKFKMPSFGGSVVGKSIEASENGDLDMSLPKVEVDVSLPSAHSNLKTGDLSVQLPSVDMDVMAGHVALQLPEDQAGEAMLADVDVAAGGLKGHLPKLKTPSFKIPKVDFKAPQVDIKGPKLDVRSPKAKGASPHMDVTLPSTDVELPAPDASLEADIALGDKDVVARDSKFKMPKFKMPSFGGSTVGKSIEASVHGDRDVSLPKVELDVSLSSAQGDLKTSELSVQIPSVDVDIKEGHVAVQLPEAQAGEATLADDDVAAGGLKGHLPKVKTPSFKMPKVDFKAPQVDIKGPKLDVRGSSPSLDVTLPIADVHLQDPDASLEVDIALGDKDVATRDSKFKMPKFKMPSFGGSAAGKSIKASVHGDMDVSLPKVEADVSLPSAHGDLKTSDLSIQLPSVDMDVMAGHVAMQLPEDQAGVATLADVDVAAGNLKGHLPKLKTPSFKMPKLDFKEPQVDIKGPKLDKSSPKAEGASPHMGVMLPSVDVELPAPDASLEADIALGDKDVAARDSKYKMPKFKTPSFDGSAAGKSIEASVHGDWDVSLPKVELDVSLPSTQGYLKTSELSVQIPSVDVDVKTVHVGMQLPEPQAGEATLKYVDVAAGGLKGHLPKVKTPCFKMPKVDFKAPQVDIKGPKLDMRSPSPSVDMTLPSADVDLRAPDASLEADIALDVEAKFKMPSFGGSVAGKPIEASVHGDLDVSLPKVEVDMSLPSAQGNLKTGDISVQLPSVDMDVQGGHVTVQLPENQADEATLADVDVSAGGLKGHLPKVKTPSFKMPKMDFKAPQVNIKGPKLDVRSPKAESASPHVDVTLPSVDEELPAADALLEADIPLGDKDVVARDSKFKMPKFKMPSFGSSVAGKSIEASVHSDLDVSLPKVEADVSLPSTQGDLKTGELSVQFPSMDMDVKAGQVAVQLPESQSGEDTLANVDMAAGGLKVHLPKVKTPSFKMPKVDFKAPQVDIKGPKLDVRGPSPSVQVTLPCTNMDMQAPDASLEADITLGDNDVVTRDSKFKMPKFKMPSFGGSAAGKSIEASVHGDLDVSLPKVEDVSPPSAQGDLKTGNLSVQLPSMEVDIKAGHVAVQHPEAQVGMATLTAVDMAAGGLKGHLPKVKTPSFKMPKRDFKAPQVDIKDHKLDVRGPKAEGPSHSVGVTLPSVDVDLPSPDASLEADIDLGDKDGAARDSKFKMPKFKMPSFGSNVAGKSIETSMHGDLDVSLHKVEADMSLPSAQGDLKTSHEAVQLPEAQAGEATLMDVDVAAGGLKGHLPKVTTPSFKMPKVDFKAPQVDIKGSKLDVRGPKAKGSSLSVDVTLPSPDMKLPVPDSSLEADIALGDKEVAARDSKFKMTKLKMPSIGGSAAGKFIEASVHGDLDVSLPKVEADVSLPSAQADLNTGDLSIQLPSMDVDIKAGHVAVQLPEAQFGKAMFADVDVEAGGLKGHMPKLKTPSFKMPKVDFKSPQVDIKGPKLDERGPSPSVDVMLPSADVVLPVPDAFLEADIALGDKGVETKDSKFKMPKFKMPSFGSSATVKSTEASVHGDLDVSLPKVEADMSLPSTQGKIKTGDLSVQLPSMDVDVKAGLVAMQLPDAQFGKAMFVDVDAEAGGLKGHMPKVKTPSFKMPKVDFKAPQVDIKGPKLDVRGPSPSMDVMLPSADVVLPVPDASLEADITLVDKDVEARDSKFKMPKFKMPSFGGSATGKSIEASVHGDLDVSLPKVEADVSLPSTQGKIKTGDLSVQLPSMDVDVKAGLVAMQLPVVQAGEATLTDVDDAGGSLKGHLPMVKTPSFKMPKVDFKAPQVDIKVPKFDVRDPSPSVHVMLPSADVDLSAPNASLETDIALGDKDMAARDSKFKMPSFGGSASGKYIEASVHGDLDVSLPKVEMDVSLPSAQDDFKTGDLSVQLPSVDMDIKAGHVAVQLPEAQAGDATLVDVDVEAGVLKGHLPKVNTPSFKMPKLDFKAPQVDIKGSKLDVRGPKAKSPISVDVTLPSTDVDLPAPDASLQVDIALGDKDMAARDSKFKMPKFKMPSFGSSAAGKSIEASVHSDMDVSLPKVEMDVSLPSAQGGFKTGDLSVQHPSVDMDVKAGHVALQLPEVQAGDATVADVDVKAGGLKGHLPKVKTPSFKMPKVDFKAPQVDIKGSKLDVRGPKAKGTSLSVDVMLPSADVDLPDPDARLQADIALGDKEVAARDSKFKMPKFKMPSFGGSAADKSIEASVHGDLDVSLPKVEADVSLPSAQADLNTGDLSIQLPSMDVDVKAGHVAVQLPEAQAGDATLADVDVEAVGLKGHLPNLKTPRFKMPKIDFKAPQVDIKGPKFDMRGPSPSVDVTLPSADVDLPAPDASLEADIALGDIDVATRDSKFKMPKFKMPSFGSSAASKSIESSVHSDLDVSLPKVETDVSLSSALGDFKTGDLSVQLPSLDVDVKAGHVAIQLPEAQADNATLPDVNMKAGSLKGHLPKVKTPSFKMPKVDLKAPQVDIKGSQLDLRGPKAECPSLSVDVTLPSTDVDLPAPDVSLQADIALGDKDVVARDSKFKMPKFKMLSFGGSADDKSIKASVHGDLDVSLPKVEVDVSLPSAQADLSTGDLSIQLPSVDVDVKAGHVAVQLPEAQAGDAMLADVNVEAGGLKGHLPKVKTPSFKMPKVDFKAPQVDIKGPKLDMRGPKAEVPSPSMDMMLPSVDVDLPAPDASLEADISLGDSDGSARDIKFKMPQFRLGFRRLSSSKITCVSDTNGDLPPNAPVVSSEVVPKPAVSECHVSSDVDKYVGTCEGKSERRKFRKPHFKMPKFFSSSEKPVSSSVSVQHDSGMSSSMDKTMGSSSATVCPLPQLSDVGQLSLSASSVGHQFPSDASFVASESGTSIKYPEDPPHAADSHVFLLDTPEGVSVDFSYATTEEALLSPVDCHPEVIVPILPTLYGPVTFPKFHRPRFQYSDPRMVAGVEAPCVLGAPDVSGLCSAQGLDPLQRTVTDPQLLHSGADTMCLGTDGPSLTERTSEAVVGGAPIEGTDHTGKGSPLKMPRLKLPSFRWSPKKDVPKPHLADVKLSVTIDSEKLQGVPQVHIPPEDVPLEEGEGTKLGETGPVLSELTLPVFEASQDRAGLPLGEPHLTLSKTLGANSHTKDPGTTGQHSLSLGNSEACGYGEVSGWQSSEKSVTPTTENSLLPSYKPKDAEVSSTEGATSRDSWFRLPTFRLLGLPRASSKEKGEAAELEKVPNDLPDASSTRDAAPATVMGQGLLGEVAVPLHSPKSNEDKKSPESASYADVLHRHLQSTSPGSGHHSIPGRPSSPAEACSGEDPLLLLTRVSFSEVPGSEAEAVKRPLTLAAPSTQGPSLTSHGVMGTVWEDSVLKVRFPKLKVPRFTFPAPSSEADIFIPTVREVWDPENHLHLTLQTESPDIWGATILKEGEGKCNEKLKDYAPSSKMPPISKVRVRIQGAQVESHAVTIHSRDQAGSADSCGPKTFTTETVHESETPASQMASYGFSLLKGRIPAPTLQSGVYLGAQDIPGLVVLSTDSQESFEVIASDREPTVASEVGSGTQCANSGSDEEPAEILEFPPDDSPEATLAEHNLPKEKLESKRSSGLFRFWFPNIGFSPSTPDERSTTSGAQVQQTDPVQKQPEARPESGLSGKHEKAGWFRFPKLGFSSPPTENCQTTREEASLAEQNIQEETVTFFDAQETFSPGEEEEQIRDAEATGTAASSEKTK